MTDRTELIARYKRLRGVSRKLHEGMMEYVEKDAFQQCGKRLGILRDGILVFQSEDQSSVLMDHCIHDHCVNGRTTVERYLAAHPPAPGTDEELVLKAMASARYSILQVREVVKGVGIRALDALHNDQLLVVDLGLSETAVEGVVLATRVFVFDDFAMTGGAALVADPGALSQIQAHLERTCVRRGIRSFGDLSPDERCKFHGAIIRSCLESEAASRVEYEDVVEPEQRAPDPPVDRPGPQVGRNAPCPCGSGKKFKKCCGR